MKNTISGNPGRAFMKLLVDSNTDKVRRPLPRTFLWHLTK
jgi:hypothetical protein